MQDNIFVPAGAGEQLKILGSTHFTKLTPEQAGGALTALEISIPPDCGPPMHAHASDSELVYVLDGVLTVSGPNGDVEARPGDVCFLPAGGWHAWRNNTGSNVRAFFVITPGLEAHRFFTEIDRRLEGAVDVAVVNEVAGRTGVSFAG
jgi:quercetin dioxygenase-like cupin family protein